MRERAGRERKTFSERIGFLRGRNKPMKLKDFLRIVPESQKIWLCYEVFIVEADNEAMSAVLSESVYNGVVGSVEADSDLLKVWVKEE